MAYFDIQYHNYKKPLREYFNKQLSDAVALKKIEDLGDEGLMKGTLEETLEKNGKTILRKMNPDREYTRNNFV